MLHVITNIETLQAVAVSFSDQLLGGIHAASVVTLTKESKLGFRTVYECYN